MAYGLFQVVQFICNQDFNIRETKGKKLKKSILIMKQFF